MDAEAFRERLAAQGVLPVVTLADEAQAVPLAGALWEAGMTLVEITLRTAAGCAAVAAVRRALPELTVGAGTVRDPRALAAAREAGAQFAVSPGVSPALLAAARNFLFLPGVATASDLLLCLEAGRRLVKFFPAEAMGGVATLRALAAPFPEVTFCPTGGIGPHNLAGYLQIPAVVAVGGSWMLSADRLARGDYAAIARAAREAMEQARAARGGPPVPPQGEGMP
ncbi:MAG: 2-dehydro-3-deoxy-phosphogluconate aldolase [Porticoccaceae bacterium]|nr:MAG: 2-dehydro-3-deoxy-phosphogluconate aldolase [Porticoccaceae bacterium]